MMPTVRILLLMAWLVLLQALASTSTAFAEEPDDTRCHSLAGQDVCIAEQSYRADICTAIKTYASHWNLPAGYLARLIWQESRFDPAALSPAGAQGIAQFMPTTARLRGLRDPFDPAEAMARSAEYLRFLEQKFGNLGLAAAAYNSGEGRTSRYVASGGGRLPAETRNYVQIITGHSVEQWLAGTVGEVDYALAGGADFVAACIDMARSVRVPDLTTSPAQWQPWGVLIAQNGSAELARTRFAAAQTAHTTILGNEQLMLIGVRNPSFGNRLRFSAMVGRQSQQAAQDLCERLLAAGGNCIVLKNTP
jgi:hypothetical protein